MAHSCSADIDWFAVLSGMQEPVPGSRINHFPDPEVHELYRGFVHDLNRRSCSFEKILSVTLQTSLKDPKVRQRTSPVTIRREKKVVLELSLHSDSRPIDHWGWKGIQLPQTRSVKSDQQAVPGEPLKLSIQVSGYSADVPNAQPCSHCWDRERALDPTVKLPPYMIDFQAKKLTTLRSGPLDGNRLKVDVSFHFTCFSHHHGGSYR